MSDQLADRVGQPTNRAPQLLTVEALQERLVAGRSTVFNLIASGELRSVKIGRRRVVSETALAEYIERIEREQAGTTPS
jgi:excisionase family DNA binding protein